jgi:hypothetical protein
MKIGAKLLLIIIILSVIGIGVLVGINLHLSQKEIRELTYTTAR